MSPRGNLMAVSRDCGDAQILSPSPFLVCGPSPDPFGRAFGVLRVKGIDADFSLPRRDSKRGRGHRGFDVAFDPDLDFTPDPQIVVPGRDEIALMEAQRLRSGSFTG